jgi:histidinol-phosphate aminotransferase
VLLDMVDITDFIRPHLKKIKPYHPGKPIAELQRELGITSEIVKLASNENTLGPSPLAIEAVLEEAKNLWLYPEDSVFYLKEALSKYHDVPTDMIVVGNGAVEVIYLLAQALFAPGDEAIMGQPSFMIYEIMSQMHDGTKIGIGHPDWRNDLKTFGEHVSDRTKIIWIDNPNNPCGTYNGRAEVEDLIAKVNGRAVIVMDEAYIQFADAPDYPDAIEYVKQGKTVVALRTFSKIVGLAGIRCGYGVMHPTLAKVLESLRIKFSVNSLAQAAVLASLKDTAHMARSRKMVIDGRNYFYERLDKLGLRYCRSQGNFIWIDFGHDSKELNSFLLREGVIVRPGWVFGAPSCARVSISTEHDNEFFFTKLKMALDANVMASK